MGFSAMLMMSGTIAMGLERLRCIAPQYHQVQRTVTFRPLQSVCERAIKRFAGNKYPENRSFIPDLALSRSVCIFTVTKPGL